MPSTATYTPTGDLRIDGVLSGIKWGVSSLTFSFPTSGSFYGTSYGNSEHTNGFEAFTSVQQDAVRTILKMYAAVSNMTFTEVVEYLHASTAICATPSPMRPAPPGLTIPAPMPPAATPGSTIPRTGTTHRPRAITPG